MYELQYARKDVGAIVRFNSLETLATFLVAQRFWDMYFVEIRYEDTTWASYALGRWVTNDLAFLDDIKRSLDRKSRAINA